MTMDELLPMTAQYGCQFGRVSCTLQVELTDPREREPVRTAARYVMRDIHRHAVQGVRRFMAVKIAGHHGHLDPAEHRCATHTVK
jgi:hypothetical protein